ncbi:DNA/RNA non-specific endonuclease [Plantactinospora sp. KLBMP9567]|uniref:DNA/RNA non-specific endonuclease n=1 Tax=Plantactinospora sp. KLBMP9567 TaxID=3085900 RepID=UPI0029811E83|nr:DNA/RNA non-specific endonuclease [Plantactinospora sp. KLBMP9567]MDW5327412.1 DNA/RNA non-specific endonuclease [Plantactinospora sp. KLBMP9567]
MSSRTVLSRTRWLVGACALTLIVTLAPPARGSWAEAAQVPAPPSGQGPVDRPMPEGVRPDTAFPPDKRPPVVPPEVTADGAPRPLSRAGWDRRTGARVAAEDRVFTDVLVLPGYLLGDTSLSLYFNVDDADAPAWSTWRVTAYDKETQTEQASTTLSRDEIARSSCSGQRDYCRSFGREHGWLLDASRTYQVTVTAILDDGREIVSEPSEARPRSTIEPPAIPPGQAAGCGCGNALALTSAGQAIRANGVNTATGAFIQAEQDLAMASFGVPFASSRTYSSANGTGPFGAGWAWSYGMTVSATEGGAIVRAEDGAEATYRLDGESYRRPPGVRSNLGKAGDGWTLTTPRNLAYGFDAQGRLTSILNPRGMGVRLAYAENAITVTDASGRVAKVALEGSLIREISLPDHRKVKFFYTGQLLTARLDARGKLWKYGYAPNGLLTTVTNPDRVVEVTTEYDANSRVNRQLDALGKPTTFEWRPGERVNESITTDADGVQVYDGYRGNVLIHTQRGNGDTVHHRYDEALNRGLVVNGKHSQHEARFDDRGNPIRQDAPQSLGFHEETEYDDRNNPRKHTDANGKVWEDEYNQFDELVKSTDAKKNSISYEYDERGLLIARTDQRKKVTRYEYLPAGDRNSGLPKAVVSPMGRRVEFKYDRTGRQIAVTDPRGTVPHADRRDYTTRYEFDAQDRTTEVHEPGKDNPWRTSYDDLGRTQSQTTPMGARTEYRYFDNGLLKTVKDPRRTMSYTYTDAGRRASARLELDDQPDPVTTYAYNAKGLLHKVTSPRGNLPGANPADFTTTYFYDANDNPLRMERPYPGGITVKRDIGVDELDRTTSKVDEHNKTSTFKRDNVGNVAEVSDNLKRKTVMQYDDNGQQTHIRDPEQGVVEYKYDEAGNKTETIRATGGITSFVYDDDGMVASSTEPRGNLPDADKERFTTHYEYDLAGNPKRTIDPLDHVTSYSYDANNRLTSVTDAKKRTTHYTYRDDNLPRSVRTPDAAYDRNDPTRYATVYDYFDDGLVASVRDPNGKRTWLSYDDGGRLTKSTDPLGRVTEYGYDVEGNRVSTLTRWDHERLKPAERAKRTVVDTYDIVNRREKRNLGTEGPEYRWEYDAKDRITSYVDPAGHRTVKYDDEDQIELVTRVEAGLEERFRYEYDVRGNIKLREYPDGTKISTTYDADSQMKTLTAEGGSIGATPAKWTFDYDKAGRREVTWLPAATGLIERRKYDDAGRLTGIGTERASEAPQVELPDAGLLAFGDRPDPPTGVTAQPGAGLAVVSWKPPRDDDVAGYTVTAAPGGRTTTVGATATSAVVHGLDAGTAYTFTVTAHDRDGAGEASKPSDPVTPVALPQDPVSAFQLTLDEVGNPSRVVTTRGGVSESVAYAYDKADRLTSACYAATSCDHKSRPTGRIDYRYDLMGNRLSQKRSGTAGDDTTSYSYDDANQLTKQVVREPRHVTTTEYGYDVDGNQTRAGTDRFEYHLDNTLAKAKVAGREAVFGYGADGLRLTATTDPGKPEQTTQRWSWDVAGTLPQIALDTVTDAAGQPTEKRGFTYGPDDEPLALLDQASGAHPYTHDWLGGVANMLTPTGTPETGYDYDPFGNPRAGPTLGVSGDGAETQAGAPENPLQYTGAYQDSTTGNGNYYLRARNYNPGTGRFTSIDPMPMGGAAVSPYTYAENNPTTYTDPTGATPEPAPAGDTPQVNPEDVARANQIQSKSVLDVVLEAGGQILMEFLGINDILNCLKGDLGACASMIIGALPWGKIFKAKKIAEAIFRAGKAVVTFFKELDWARAILRNAERAAEAAKAAAAKAAREAAAKAAAAKAAAERAAREAAARAAERAKALAAKAKAATKRSTTCKRNSFVAGTLVMLADGPSKPIEDVEPGDAVLATDPETGRTESRQVTHAIRTDNDKEYVELTLDADEGGTKITSTDHHRFWSVDQGRWVNAADLRPGELLRTAAGTYVQVGALRKFHAAQTTYDLTVDDVHTYYVSTGNTSVLVHNCGDKYAHGGSVRYGALDGRGRPTSVSASIHGGILDKGSAASRRIKPPGWASPGDEHNIARGHLLARMLGGSGYRKSNLVTITQDPVNSPIMRDLEQQVYDAVKAGETVQYTASAVYHGDELVPIAIKLEAVGSKGFRLNAEIPNPAGVFGFE